MTRKHREPAQRASHLDATYLQTTRENDARLQPDPELELSTGAAGRAQIWLVAMSSVVIVGLVLYAISQTHRGTETAASPPAETTGAAPVSDQTSVAPQPQENATPADAEQVPGKQGPSDSAR